VAARWQPRWQPGGGPVAGRWRVRDGAGRPEGDPEMGRAAPETARRRPGGGPGAARGRPSGGASELFAGEGPAARTRGPATMLPSLLEPPAGGGEGGGVATKIESRRRSLGYNRASVYARTMGDKQAALVNSIADGVHAKMTPDLAKLAEQLTKMSVTSCAIMARLETLESAVGAGGAASKRAVRTTGAAGAKGGAKGPAGKKPTGDAGKVTNALLYFRYIMGQDLDDARETYATEENLLEAESDATVAKRDKDKDPSGYYSAVAAALWKSTLTDDQKTEIRNQFTAWKEEMARGGAGAQLDEELDN